MPLRILPLPQGSETRAARILDARTHHLASRGAVRESGPVSPPLLLCTLGNEAYGLPLASVAQVVPFAPCTPAPGQPAAMLGFHGRAGQVFVVLDLGLALGMGAARQGGHLLLLRHAPRRFALRVDRALSAADSLPLVEAEAAQDAPGQPAAPRHGAIAGHAMAPAGMAGNGDALVGLIDLDRLLRPFMAGARNTDPAATGA
ncbi:chemotaxis protein CheW [Pseudoroseomonas wenyumeiae]|uniref:Chemotaxis protein CheW n=1 Tax=Teichococcus wenyumeiae TaxID=2478470 RepID=A0A3A9JKL6_9PROT|nr:chemotaxis protein CheW [Pseudoroseomonas wenyumeiae]RKK01088.1 chemotaxis protein CheW [Pseudoroseomonas wenyumeiae]RMI26299.1 chemotaxis protein CheW [Pseudoroseomonas wenyumeiae]